MILDIYPGRTLVKTYVEITNAVMIQLFEYPPTYPYVSTPYIEIITNIAFEI